MPWYTVMIHYDPLCTIISYTPLYAKIVGLTPDPHPYNWGCAMRTEVHGIGFPTLGIHKVSLEPWNLQMYPLHHQTSNLTSWSSYRIAFQGQNRLTEFQHSLSLDHFRPDDTCKKQFQHAWLAILPDIGTLQLPSHGRVAWQSGIRLVLVWSCACYVLGQKAAAPVVQKSHRYTVIYDCKLQRCSGVVRHTNLDIGLATWIITGPDNGELWHFSHPISDKCMCKRSLFCVVLPKPSAKLAKVA